MNWKDLAGVVGKAAPLVGGLLGGPVGAAAGGLVARALGVAESPDAVAAALQQDPQAALKLAELQSLERVRLAELAAQTMEAQASHELGLVRADHDDRANARSREVATSDATPKILAYLVTLGFFGVIAASMAFGMPEHGKDSLLILLGSLGTAWTGVIAYYFGSSAGSARKTDLIGKHAGAKA